MQASLQLPLIFLATFGLVAFGLYVAAGRLQAEDAAAETDEPLLLRAETVSSISFWAALLERFRFVANLRRLIGEAGLPWSAGRFTMLMLLAGASMAVVLSRIAWLPGLGVLGGGLLATLAPFFFVQAKRQQRFDRFDENFPDALDSLSRAMRAGNSLAAGIEMVAHEAAPPVANEFRLMLDEWRLGRTWEQALAHLARRVPLVSVSLFAAAVTMQSRTGGRLHEILGRISEGVRDSAALEGEVRAISAHGKLTGLILTVLPIGIAVMLHMTAPGYLEVLRDHPVGKYFIVAAIFFLISAHFVMRRILDIRI